jgi:NAD(P)H-dependent FMN reductase
MINLKIITASTRPGRKGPLISQWVTDVAKSSPDFNVELLDLAVINLPFLDEPHHPRLQNYLNEHTKQWSKTISEADVFIIVTCEYNYGFPAPLKNAIDFLHREWFYKAVGIVSYGGLAGGTRAVQMLKLVLTTLKMTPLVEGVAIPFFDSHIKDGAFLANEAMNNGLNGMLKELTKVDKVLRVLRN